MITVNMTINDRLIGPIEVDDNTMMIDFLHEYVNLTGTKFGCGVGVCHACTIVVDGADGSSESVRTCINGVWYPSATGLGTRPTVNSDETKVTCETFIPDFSGDLYGERLSVRFWHKLRDEMKFDSLDALKAAIGKDCNDVRAWFSTHPEYLSLREQNG